MNTRNFRLYEKNDGFGKRQWLIGYHEVAGIFEFGSESEARTLSFTTDQCIEAVGRIARCTGKRIGVVEV